MVREGFAGVEKAQLIGARHFRRIVASGFGAQNQQARVSEPIHEQRERNSQDEEAYEQGRCLLPFGPSSTITLDPSKLNIRLSPAQQKVSTINLNVGTLESA